ncbi:limonene-1,2-epoxide hydrolase family protein [[Mycobacterium] vasticus]|uniref:Limonene-1,2-epoxide hydrolase family protein n=1 Tax=[Mycobacterium] vasticus TaxID=2875777 RepID=A0ABU5Z2P3_9MYCO|nr:limonene-1,2-epoxide hydrolase family protein [Mycolicibacter sp. MYC017]MEB3071679.1 limonene-1,2-epoxide hydrolase family protein [Mycolicibacter sp. MYC017]
MNALQTVEAFLDAYWSQDHDRTLSLVTEDFSWPNLALPLSSIDSRAALGELLVHQNMGFPEPIEAGHHDTVNALVDNGLVLHERVDHWVLRGTAMNCPCCAVFQVVDGKVALWRDYYDIGYVLRQFESVGIKADTSQWF